MMDQYSNLLLLLLFSCNCFVIFCKPSCYNMLCFRTIFEKAYFRPISFRLDSGWRNLKTEPKVNRRLLRHGLWLLIVEWRKTRRWCWQNCPRSLGEVQMIFCIWAHWLVGRSTKGWWVLCVSPLTGNGQHVMRLRKTESVPHEVWFPNMVEKRVGISLLEIQSSYGEGFQNMTGHGASYHSDLMPQGSQMSNGQIAGGNTTTPHGCFCNLVFLFTFPIYNADWNLLNQLLFFAQSF